MGLLNLIASQVDPVAALRAKFPQLFANGEQLGIPQGNPLDRSSIMTPPPAQELPPVDPTQQPVYSPTIDERGAMSVPAVASSAIPEPAPAPPAVVDTGAPANPPGGHKRGGILGALESVFMPAADSRWYAALNNPNGLVGARGAQEALAQKRQADQIATQTAQQKLDTLRTKGEYQVVGNSVFHIKPDGSTEMISAQTTGEQERLIDKWRQTPPGPERDLIERAIKGYQYTPGVIAAQGAARTNTAVAGANARGKFKSSGGGSKKSSSPGAGFTVQP